MQNAVRLTAVNETGLSLGLRPGMMLTDARARLPALVTVQGEPERDREALEGLARWCERYTPLCAVDAQNGLWLDVTGIAHLFGGEEGLLERLSQDLEALGLHHRLGLAPTPGAAWAVARFAATPVVPEGCVHDALNPLPVEALRLAPDTVTMLHRLGLKRIGQLTALPRASLERRFRGREAGESVLRRLDEATGRLDEPLVPVTRPTRFRSDLRFPEPVQDTGALTLALEQLCPRLCAALEREGRGARHLTFTAYRVDGQISTLSAGTSHPEQDPAHLIALIAPFLDTLDAGFGIDQACLQADETAPFETRQDTLARNATSPQAQAGATARLIDRLSVHLGRDAVLRHVPRDAHLPEEAEQWRAALGHDAPAETPPCLPSHRRRPLFLLEPPEPVTVMAALPDGPPLQFRWRHVLRHVARAAGPERLAPPWWRMPGETPPPPRDYYRVEDRQGRRYWIFRTGLYEEAAAPPDWHVHGFFA